jgi:hypothetical protein
LSKIGLEKLIVAQQLKFPALYWTQRSITMFARAWKSEALCVIFFNMLLWSGVVSPHPVPLPIQYISSYSPYLGAISSIQDLRTCNTMLTSNPLKVIHIHKDVAMQIHPRLILIITATLLQNQFVMQHIVDLFRTVQSRNTCLHAYTYTYCCYIKLIFIVRGFTPKWHSW